MAEIAPSLLAADFTDLAGDMKRLRRSGARILHLDIMDGNFVPNITFGSDLVGALRPLAPGVCFDTHLMVLHPSEMIENLSKAGADNVTIHAECSDNVAECLREIRRLGMKCGVSVKPGTPVETVLPYIADIDLCLVMTVEPGFGGQSIIPECLDKLAVIRSEAEKAGNTALRLSIDGGVTEKNCALAAAKGAEILVAGTAVFGARNMTAAFRRLSAAVADC